MRRIRWVLPVLLAIGVAASGCVYWRLLQFKKQLNSFDEHFEFRADTYSLVIKKPVLTGSDFDWLMEVEPTLVSNEAPGLWRIYEYIKDPPDDTPPLVFSFAFREDRLVEARFPEQWRSLYPPEVMRAFFRSMGKADVEKRRKSARGSFDAALRPLLPSRDTVLASLGAPTESEPDSSDGGESLVYRYRLRTGTVGEKERKRRSYGRFSYDANGAISRLETGIGKHELIIKVPAASPEDDSADKARVFINR